MERGFDIDIFPSKVVGYDLNNIIDPDYVSNIVWDIHSSLHKPALHSLLDGGLSNFSDWGNILDDIRLVELKHSILVAAQDYSDTMGFTELDIVNSWANISSYGTQLKNHSHSLALSVCAYYPSLPNGSSNLFMSNENLKKLQTRNVWSHKAESENIANKTPTPYNQMDHEIHLQQGWVYFFPGYQKHWAPANKTSERIVISANFNTKGNVRILK